MTNPTPLEGSELPLEYAREYDGAAEHVARTGNLPANMGSPGAIDFINAAPEAFEDRVRQFKYAQACETTERKFALVAPLPFDGHDAAEGLQPSNIFSMEAVCGFLGQRFCAVR